MATSVRMAHAACAVNRSSHALACGPSGLVAFASARSVVIYEPRNAKHGGRVLQAINGHNGKVNCVHWISKSDRESELELLSGASDNLVLLWKRQDKQFTCSGRLEGHEGPVTALDSINLASHDLIIVTAAADSSVRVWRRPAPEDAAVCVQVLSFGNGFVLALALALLPGTEVPILTCGGNDRTIDLYALQENKMVLKQRLVGHEDWVRDLDFAINGPGDLLLASCSQDGYIRLWQIGVQTEKPPQDMDAPLRVTENAFIVSTAGLVVKFIVTAEAVLAGHDGWVLGVHWQSSSSKGVFQSLRLLSCSMDKTMVIWAPDPDTGVWLEQVRVGDVGGNTLGFLGCQFRDDGRAIMGYVFHGALQLWCFDSESQEWNLHPAVSGHAGSVNDLAWDPAGLFLLSAGADQTTRLFAQWVHSPCVSTWHEFCRPQIHGYALQCLSPLPHFRFVSGADEKLLRAFAAPRHALENLARLASLSCVHLDLEPTPGEERLAEGACIPALGLSNKAVFQEPPAEHHLLQNTLWPEVQKLYGHGFEIFAVATDPGSTLIASACKASHPDQAAILLWSVAQWRLLGSLIHHNLTVTALAFSPDGSRLLAASRDRTWSLWQRRDKTDTSKEELPFVLIGATDKATAVHSRLIWDCAWSHDSDYFVTAGRDHKVVVWKEGQEQPIPPLGSVQQCSSVHAARDAVTAVAFAPRMEQSGCYIVAMGLECGGIVLHMWNHKADRATGADWLPLLSFDEHLSHALTVNRLCWRPLCSPAESERTKRGLQLASAGADHMVKIFDVTLC
uniref:elongator complex protein 2 isoform X2 n=1 Tax=Myxine glutinosa TaxID=7769 RepID=UPI00358DF2B5